MDVKSGWFEVNSPEKNLIPVTGHGAIVIRVVVIKNIMNTNVPSVVACKSGDNLFLILTNKKSCI